MAWKDNFDTIKSTAAVVAQSAAKKTRQLISVTKANLAILAEEDKIKKAHAELGKLYYAEKGASPDGAYVAACERIDAARAAIETNNDRIAELKTAGDAVIVDDGPIVDGPVAQPTEEATQADFAEEETAAPEEAPKTEE